MFTILKKIFFAFSRAERVAFLTALVLALSSSVSIGALLLNQKTVVIPARGGSYTEGILGQPAHVNPVTASTEADKSLVELLFADLADLADKITVDKSGKIWDIRLKENIRWSDGEKLTSDDVIFTIQKIQDPDSGSALSSSWQSAGANRVSELELRITLGNPYYFFLQNLQKLNVIPKHLFAEAPVSNWRLSRYNLQPVSSGPYSFDSYEVREDGFITAYHLKPNKFYFSSSPLINEFNLKFFPNTTQIIYAFNSGQVDGFAIGSGEAGGIMRPYEAHGFSLPSYYAIFFNQGQNLTLQDKKVRQALSVATDRKKLVGDILNDGGEIRFGPFSPSLLSNPQSQPDDFSFETAGSILDDGGWIMASSTIRQKTIKGAKINLEFSLTIPQIPFLLKTAEKLQSDWAKIGIKVDLITMAPDEISGDTVKNRNYQALLFGNMPNPPADLFAFWHSSQRFYPGLNLSLYNNKQADGMITDISQNGDSSKRALEIQNLQNLIAGDYPAVFLYSPYYVYFSRKDLQGVQAGLINESVDRFASVEKWYLKTARSLK
ncbi:MAG: ABC transporter substrate-binding protein [Candidatus Liptonbacteria bacterium]|nr:ABC transporter substrate-binding protein [Candidatus Liptonbacteria bacterium]